MTALRSKCEGCGMCCRAIFLADLQHSYLPGEMRFNREKPRKMYENIVQDVMDDKTFVMQNWYPLTQEEVLQRNPFVLKELERTPSLQELDESTKKERINALLSNNFYGCSQLDESTGRCMTHENLPKVCSGYPHYRHEKLFEKDTFFYTDDCYYRKDIMPDEEVIINDGLNTKSLEV